MSHGTNRRSYRFLGALALAVATAPWMACLDTGSVQCSSDLLCPEGQICSADQMACIKTPCGNGVIDFDERCDDGNITDGDGCSRDCSSDESCGNRIVDLSIGEACDDGNRLAMDGCSANCKSSELCGNGITDYSVGEVCDDKNLKDGDGCSANCRSDETCGNGTLDKMNLEVCDDGNNVSNDGCSADCLSGEGCGNNTIDPGEECDDGNPHKDDDCVEIHNTCRIARCGDGWVNRQGINSEVCDDGNNITEASCAYDVRTCTHCTEDCKQVLALEGAWCGDGVTNGREREKCDDGNNVTEASCPYGTGRCTACDATCAKVLNLTGPYCGDGIREVSGSHKEQCDDGNDESCGTCNSTCKEERQGVARGSITVKKANLILDETRFILSDGINGAPVIFEFDTNKTPSTSFIPIELSDKGSNEDAAAAIVAAINRVGTTLRIIASTSGATVNLEHEQLGEFGNRSITTPIDASILSVDGMKGGAGASCDEGIGCMRNEDCKPHLVCRADKTCGPP